MASQLPSHEDGTPSSERPLPSMVPMLHVQRSLSNEAITIHFSALGKEEEEEEEELSSRSISATSPSLDNTSIVTAEEANEEMFEGVVGGIPDSSRLSSLTASPTQALSNHIPVEKASASLSLPTKSSSFPSSDKPFLRMVKSLSSDGEVRDGVSSSLGSSLRHRQLMKSLVKSLSSDTSQDSSSSSSTTSHRLNLQLFKQFTQSKMPSATTSSSTASDSKTAPSSPLTSLDTRSFFKVADVEARLEDTKRRLSEAMSEPLQLLSKIIDEKGSSLHRSKVSSSGTELSTVASINGHLESNNNYCIKEEDSSVLDAASPSSESSESSASPSVDTKSQIKSSSLSKTFDAYSMAALAKQEDEDFCILSTDDLDLVTQSNVVSGTDRIGRFSPTKVPLNGSVDSDSEDESESPQPASGVPVFTLLALFLFVYGCFLVPLPIYIGGMLLGIALGFLLAIGVVWLTSTKSSGVDFRRRRKLRNHSKLDIKEPEIYKGWMNEIQNYDPETYHTMLTQSVYVRLEGSVIRLSKPNRNIPRRAAHKEAKPKPDIFYISQKYYDMTNCKVYLSPPNLARKRIWNKKYPICIGLSKQDDFMSKAEGEKGEASDSTKDKEASGIPDRGSSSSVDLTLYLFGRTGKEKEEWFHRFLFASKLKDSRKGACPSEPRMALSTHSRSNSHGSLDETLISPTKSKDLSASSAVASSPRAKPLLDYKVYMRSLLPKESKVSPSAASPVLQSPQSSPGSDKKLQSTSSAQAPPSREEDESTVAWVNAALGRLFWDFLNEPYWGELVSKKIQMKLSKIRLPYFMEELTLTELDMGMVTPRILRASKPSVDYRGLWFDLEVSYQGSFLMTLETKMILNRLGKEDEIKEEFGKDGPRTYCLADSDDESSSAGSADEEDFSEVSSDTAGAESLVGGHKPSKIMRFVDKITKSKYFQKARETEFIKKKMEEVSNTPLLLTVELQQLQGTLTVNIPPPPTDRIWYGFRDPPQLELKARPKLGEREVTLGHVTDWIENKLDKEFQKILVMPNMDDVWLPIMHSAFDSRTQDEPDVRPSLESETSQPDEGSTSQPDSVSEM
ncbi:testis-expressed protein 2-like isoform X2 [Gouania willdenowi]|uniref:testis-expressed protein 2-like isoform X2 n=1 Tax=Gouania willdenowi TaxID=441366 RepID=UPI0010560C52|nr:testis-expressed protein 2-like isoform X2 [Gouania willdenowi]